MKKILMILPLTMILCFMVGCQDKEAMAELEAMKAQAELEEQNIELVRNSTDAWRERNYETIREFFAPNFSYYSPSNSKPLSLDEVIERVKMMLIAFPDFAASFEEIIAKGDKVVVREVVRCTHQGEFYGIPPTGNKVESSEIAIFRIENGKIAEVRIESNSLGFMMQLGMELKPKEKE
jgi:steroid delta-isomerase-like uncharacterized protein